MTILAPQPPVETTTQSPLGEAVPITRHRFAPSPLNRAAGRISRPTAGVTGRSGSS